MRRDGSETVVWRALRVAGVTFAGVFLVVLGIILIPLPGPGSLIVLLGLGILGTEYAWARRAVAFVRGGAEGLHLKAMAKWRAWRGAHKPARLPESRPA